jgi:hypothetical protein
VFPDDLGFSLVADRFEILTLRSPDLGLSVLVKLGFDFMGVRHWKVTHGLIAYLHAENPQSSE